MRVKTNKISNHEVNETTWLKLQIITSHFKIKSESYKKKPAKCESDSPMKGSVAASKNNLVLHSVCMNDKVVFAFFWKCIIS
jgi:hypothetical protein